MNQEVRNLLRMRRGARGHYEKYLSYDLSTNQIVSHGLVTKKYVISELA